MKHTITPTIKLEDLLNEIRVQFNTEPSALADEFALVDTFPDTFYYNREMQKIWKECAEKEEGNVYTELLMAAAILEDNFPTNSFIFITKD